MRGAVSRSVSVGLHRDEVAAGCVAALLPVLARGMGQAQTLDRASGAGLARARAVGLTLCIRPANPS